MLSYFKKKNCNGICEVSTFLLHVDNLKTIVKKTLLVKHQICLLINLFIFKETLSNEEEEQRHVVDISSEENIHENKAMAMTSSDAHKETKLIKQSQASLLLNFELQSEKALPQMLQTFKGTQFSDSLTNVAGSLSRYCGSEITLKASMNVGAVLEALEESGSEYYFPLYNYRLIHVKNNRNTYYNVKV
jgi:hypothetical protein